MTTLKALHGKLYAGSPHVRFDEGEVAPAATPRRGSLLYKKFELSNVILSAIAVILTATTAMAENLTIDYGTSTNISENITLDNLTVNGNLTVDEGVTLNVTNIAVGTSYSWTLATVTLEKDAKIIVAPVEKDNLFHCVIGDRSPAVLTLKQGSLFSAPTLVCGGNRHAEVSNRSEPLARIVIENATLELGDAFGSFQTRAKSHDAKSDIAVVELIGSDALFHPLNLVAWVGHMGIKFAGGRILFDRMYNWGSSPYIRNNPWTPETRQRIYFESVGGAPIRFDCPSIELLNGRRPPIFQNMVAEALSSEIVTLGLGAFQLEGDSDSPLFKADSCGTIAFKHSGGFRVLNGARLTLSEVADRAFADAVNSDLYVEPTGLLDLYGCKAAFSGIQAYGTITNTSATESALNLRRYDAAGIIAGRCLCLRTGNTYAPYQLPDGTWTSEELSGVMGNQRWVATNMVETAPWAATELVHPLFFTPDTNVYNYAGMVHDAWIWNRSDTNETWTFAGGMGTHTHVILDDVKLIDTAEWNKPRKGSATVTPGAHHLHIRSYNPINLTGKTNPLGSGWAGWGWKVDGHGAGVRFDRFGRDSTNVADYQLIQDPGDGSLLTVSPDGLSSVLRPKHTVQRLDMAQAPEIDLFANTLTVKDLYGFGAVTNSNQYYSDGKLSVTGTWTVAGADVAAMKSLKVKGGVEWGAGATIAVTSPKSLVAGEGYVIVEASEPMTALPGVSPIDNNNVKLKVSLANGGKSLLLTRVKKGIIIIFR